jgi:hypothetical protein
MIDTQFLWRSDSYSVRKYEVMIKMIDIDCVYHLKMAQK